MPEVAVAITKQTMWHGVQEQFDNVYYFDGPTFQAGDENYQRLVDHIVSKEKAIHGTNVEFMTGRVWTSGGTALQNVTQGLYDLAGFGSLGSTPVFKELAVLVEWECDRANVLGRKVYLRKFIRPCVAMPGALDTMITGEAMLGSTAKAPFKTYADAVQQVNLISGVEFRLISPSDRRPRAGNNGVVNNYVISREFRRN